VQGLKLRWPTIAHMLELGFNLEVTPLAAEVESVSSPVAGLRVLFTGTMTNATREDMKKRARALGATLASGISKSLDLLVIGEKPSASKVAKAEKAGVRVLTESEYQALIDS
jgi:DNA ligase (NAD+)